MTSQTTNTGRRISSLVPGYRPSDAVHALFTELETLAAAEKMVVIPTALQNTVRLPSVSLGPHETGHDLGEFVVMMRGLGVHGLYVRDGLAHLHHVSEDAAPWSVEGPRTLQIECVHDGILHTWTHTG